MLPVFSHGLLSSPHLDSIRFDSIKSTDGVLGHFSALDAVESPKEGIIGHIRSIRHGAGEELLHARLLLLFKQTGDIILLGSNNVGRYNSHSKYHYTLNGICRVRTFAQLPKAIWQDFTHYRGLTVPLEIIYKMMKVEGAKDGDWERRGIEVKAETWKVLEDWRDEKMRENVEA